MLAPLPSTHGEDLIIGLFILMSPIGLVAAMWLFDKDQA